MRRGLTEAEREFLSILARMKGPATSKHLPLADRQHDRVRQSCRTQHFARFGRKNGSISGWFITDAGRAALAMQEGTDE